MEREAILRILLLTTEGECKREELNRVEGGRKGKEGWRERARGEREREGGRERNYTF